MAWFFGIPQHLSTSPQSKYHPSPRPPHINPRKAGVGRCGLRQRLHTLATQSLKPVKIDDMPGRRTRQSLAGKDDFYLTSKDSEKLIRGRKESGQPRTVKVSLSID